MEVDSESNTLGSDCKSDISSCCTIKWENERSYSTNSQISQLSVQSYDSEQQKLEIKLPTKKTKKIKQINKTTDIKQTRRMRDVNIEERRTLSPTINNIKKMGIIHNR